MAYAFDGGDGFRPVKEHDDSIVWTELPLIN